ncbi:MAG: UDP-N-acetylmuramoyl-L-alanine--D-glutamate ligase, partial [Alistipes senegalensis]|nr:UDP-N-acetylmuramoyl-L-alanine--D-glutamate ligase [Alistipes senegalensis]
MKNIVVLGGGISGYGSAILAKKKGFGVFLSDMGRIADRYKRKLDEWEVPYEEGGHTEERILAATEVVKSPGIPETAPIVRKIRAAGIPVISEMEFAGRYIGKARCICITGSNGKTTTTSLIYKIMRDAGLNVALGGNIGESFAYSVATGDYDWYVLELSSFQLDGMYKFRAHIGVLTNITPDHLDRYDHCFQNYVDSKMRITQNQTSRDWFVYSADDETIRQELPKYDLRVRQLPFMARNAVASGAGDAFLCDGKFTATAGKASVEIDMKKMRIAGLHNAYNAMAAALATLAAGVAPAKIRKSLYDFAPVEHRLEPVAEKNGVLWINDSKATNVDSVWYALESMTRPLVWIAGGTDKGNDYGPLKEFARAKVHTLVCMGLDNEKLVREFTGVVPRIVSTASLDAAMAAARAAAR